MHLADAFIQSDLQWIQAIHFFFISMCVPWELNPQRNALPLSHRNTYTLIEYQCHALNDVTGNVLSAP